MPLSNPRKSKAYQPIERSFCATGYLSKSLEKPKGTPTL